MGDARGEEGGATLHASWARFRRPHTALWKAEGGGRDGN